MRIARIESIPVRLPLKPERRMISALGKHDVSDFVLVRLHTDNGLEGVGEATVTPRWSGETMWGAKAMIDHVLAPAVLGLDPRDIDAIEQRMRLATVGNPFAMSAIEMACWDVAGRAENQPVYELLGGAVRDRTIRCRFSLGAYEPTVAAERATQLVDQGFETIKVKVGVKPEEDIRRVAAVREAIGVDKTMTIDANGGWTLAEARRCLEAMRPNNIAWVEQPLQRGDYSHLKILRAAFETPILADESCFLEVEARELLQHQCCDAITVYPGKQGGIAAAKRIAELAESHDAPCTIGSNLEWDVGAAAMLHFVVATRNMQVERLPGDCLGPSYHIDSIAKKPIAIDGPLVTLSANPGLGVDVDWEMVARHTVSDG